MIIVLSINAFIWASTKKRIYKNIYEIPNAYTVLVPGAMVWSSGKLSSILKDRMDNAYLLYKHGKVERFLLSGDHGSKYYDEVNAMKKYLLNRGVQKEDIFLDHAGFDTYSSIFRAKAIFNVKDVIIVTQKFHQPRAIFIAKHLELDAYGFIADNRKYKEIKYQKFREKLANIKAIYELIVNKPSSPVKDKVPITGDSSVTYDN